MENPYDPGLCSLFRHLRNRGGVLVDVNDFNEGGDENTGKIHSQCDGSYVTPCMDEFVADCL